VQDEVNQEDSEQNEVDRMKKGSCDPKPIQLFRIFKDLCHQFTYLADEFCHFTLATV